MQIINLRFDKVSFKSKYYISTSVKLKLPFHLAECTQSKLLPSISPSQMDEFNDYEEELKGLFFFIQSSLSKSLYEVQALKTISQIKSRLVRARQLLKSMQYVLQTASLLDVSAFQKVRSLGKCLVINFYAFRINFPILESVILRSTDTGLPTGT
jgi:hypothetical protein